MIDKKKILVFALLLISVCIPARETMDSLCRRVWNRAETQFGILAESIPDGRTPRSLNPDGSLRTDRLVGWCSGFFPGSLWYLYECTGKESVKTLAERETHRLDGIAVQAYNHDVGFMFWCSFGNAWRITGDDSWLPEIKDAAENLSGRFVPNAGITRSWNPDEQKDWKCPVIIDNMMNLELLEESSRLFGVPEYDIIARTHASTTIQNHFRSDFSSFHLVDYDPDEGLVRRKMTVQGYSDESSWARGQGWALYGFTMMHRETGLKQYLNLAENVAGYILRRLPKDHVPYWDFDDPSIPDAPRDASAGALMASAFIELSTLTPDNLLASACRREAEEIVRELASDRYLAAEGTNGGFLLKHSTGNKPANNEVDTPLTYADYYFLEALQRISRLSSKKFVAHRGLQPFGPENSIASFRAAGRHGVWAIETDFRMTKDGRVVCIHDAGLDRTTTGTGLVKDYSLEQIRRMRVRPVNSESTVIRYEYSSLSKRERRIPTMEEYLSICRRNGCKAFIELKEDGGLIKKMNRAIRRHGMTGNCIISSSDRALLKAYRESGGKEQIHLIFGTVEDMNELASDGNAAIAFDYQDLEAPIDLVIDGKRISSLSNLVKICHSKGLKVCFRAIDNPLATRKALDLGIDYFPTNNIWR